MKSFKNFVTENISNKDAKKLQRMTQADPDTAKRIQSTLDSSKSASKSVTSGETRTSESGQKTRTRPSARNTPKGVAADAKFYSDLGIGTEQGAAAQQQAAIDMKSQAKRPTSSSPKVSSGFADLNKQIDKVKPKVTTRQGRLSNQADEVLKQIRTTKSKPTAVKQSEVSKRAARFRQSFGCLLYTSPSPRDLSTSRMPSSA